MIEHVERFPRVRDRAVFIGDPDDLVPLPFGPGLPPIRDWTERHYAFAGYVPGFDPAALPADRAGLRAELGYGPEPLCLVAVGGSGVGGPLLRRVWPRCRAPASSCPACAWSPSPARGSTRRPCPEPRAWRCAATSTRCTGTSRPATSASSRAA